MQLVAERKPRPSSESGMSLCQDWPADALVHPIRDWSLTDLISFARAADARSLHIHPGLAPFMFTSEGFVRLPCTEVTPDTITRRFLHEFQSKRSDRTSDHRRSRVWTERWEYHGDETELREIKGGANFFQKNAGIDFEFTLRPLDITGVLSLRPSYALPSDESYSYASKVLDRINGMIQDPSPGIIAVAGAHGSGAHVVFDFIDGITNRKFNSYDLGRESPNGFRAGGYRMWDDVAKHRQTVLFRSYSTSVSETLFSLLADNSASQLSEIFSMIKGVVVCEPVPVLNSNKMILGCEVYVNTDSMREDVKKHGFNGFPNAVFRRPHTFDFLRWAPTPRSVPFVDSAVLNFKAGLFSLENARFLSRNVDLFHANLTLVERLSGAI